MSEQQPDNFCKVKNRFCTAGQYYECDRHNCPHHYQPQTNKEYWPYEEYHARKKQYY